MTEGPVQWVKAFWLNKHILEDNRVLTGTRGAGVKWGLCLLKSLLELDIRRNNVWGKIENGIGIKLTSVLYKSFRVLKVGNLFDYQSKIRVKMCCPVQLPPSHFTLSQSELLKDWLFLDSVYLCTYMRIWQQVSCQQIIAEPWRVWVKISEYLDPPGTSEHPSR